MTAALNPVTLTLFLLTVFPGLVSIAVYRLIMPARTLEWANGVLQGLFYSVVNFALGLPFLFLLVFGYDPLQHPLRYCVAAILLLLVLPAFWAFALVWVFKSDRLARRIQIPYPTAWDFCFDNQEPGFVLIHLPNGILIGGYYGSNSYAGSFPNDGDIYLEAVYDCDNAGHFGQPVANTRGVLLRKEQYSYIEMFSITRE